MASQATMQAPDGSSSNMHDVEDEDIENIPPPAVNATTGASRYKVTVHEADGLEGSCSQLDMGTPGRESRSPYPIRDSSHLSTPVLYSGNSGVTKPQFNFSPYFKSLSRSYMYQTISSDCHKLVGFLSDCPGTPAQVAGHADHSGIMLANETLPNCTGMSCLDFTIDSPSLPTAATSFTVGSPCISPQNPILSKETAGKLEEDLNLNTDLEMGSTLSLNSETNSVLTVRGENFSMNYSSSLQPSLDGTRDIATVDASFNGTGDVSAGAGASCVYPENNTFDVHPLQKLNSTTTLAEASTIPVNLHNTFETKPLSKLNGTRSLDESSPSDDPQNTFETKHLSKLNGTTSVDEISPSDDPQNIATDMHSLQQLNSTTTLAEASTVPVYLQTTFETKPPSILNGTTSLEEISPSDDPQTTFETKPPSILNGTTSLDEISPSDDPQTTFETKPPSKLNGTTSLDEISPSDNRQNASDMHSLPKPSKPDTNPKDNATPTKVNTLPAEANVKTVDLHDDTFEAMSPIVGTNSQSSPPMVDPSSDQDNKAEDVFLELRSDPPMYASTPMPDPKASNGGGQTGRITEVQKRLYGDTPVKTLAQVIAPSNIAGDRKTCLKVPGARSLLPPSQAGSQLLKFKPALTIPARSGLPMTMTRRRAQDEASRNAAASQETTTVPTSRNTRSSVSVGSKPPATGMRKPQATGTASGTQRTMPTLSTRSMPPPATRSSSAAAPSSATAGTRSTVMTSLLGQTRKNRFASTKALPGVKQKMDAPVVPSTTAEALITSAEPARGARGLKRPASSWTALSAKKQIHSTKQLAVTAAGNNPTKIQRQAACPSSSMPPHTQPADASDGCANCELLHKEIKRLQEELAQVRNSTTPSPPS